MQVYILIGNVGSGKSHWAKNHIENDPYDSTIIVNRDKIREMLNGKYIFDEKKERLVAEIRNASIRSALCEGFNVIIDETSLRKVQREKLIDIINGFASQVDIIYVLFNTPKEICLNNRKKESKNYSYKKWINIYEMFEVIKDPVSENENYDKLIEVNYEVSKEDIITTMWESEEKCDMVKESREEYVKSFELIPFEDLWGELGADDDSVECMRDDWGFKY